MAERKKKTVTSILVTFSILLLLLILTLFFFALRQGIRYTRILSEYEASRLSARLTELYLSGQEIDQSVPGETVSGFGVYGIDGEALLRLGEAPERITDIHPGNAGEVLFRDKNRLMVFRVSGRGRSKQDRSFGPPPVERIVTLLIYKEQTLGKTTILLVLLAGFLFTAFIGLTVGITVLYRKINRIRTREGENLRLIQLGRAARVLTHEIKNPLGSIRIQKEILAKKLPGEYRRSVEIIGEETARIARLTDRVSEFLKHPEGMPRKTDLSAAVRSVSEAAGNSVSLEDRSGGETSVFMDPDNLRSVLENIIGNAVESGGSEKPVRVVLEPARHGYAVSVTDGGPGIDPEAADRIFDLFYTTRTSGSGIGLALSKAFIEAAGGSISARNSPEGGAVFTLLIPEYKSQ